MTGSLFMMGFGGVVVLLVVAISVILVGLFVWALVQKGNNTTSAPVFIGAAIASKNFCSHCGAAFKQVGAIVLNVELPFRQQKQNKQ